MSDTPSSTLRRQPSATLLDSMRNGPRRRFIALCFLLYLALSVLLWCHVWTTHPSSVSTCGCEDPSLTQWFLAWPAYAIAHGHSPLFSRSLFFPNGINLLSNTGMLGIGIPLAPITWIFGPLATLNVASTLTPALSAASMCWLLCRYVSWKPAALIGGLVFGFSPYAVSNLAVAHLNLSFLFFVPIIVGYLDELLIRQRKTPTRVGLVLGISAFCQFFMSTEVLAIVAVMCLIGVGVLLCYSLFFNREACVSNARYSAKGAIVAILVAGVLLFYPTWFALFGPMHFLGLVWPNIKPGSGGLILNQLWRVQFTNPSAERFFAGYQGAAFPKVEYIGIPLLVIPIFGLLFWWRSRVLWLFALVGACGVWFSMGNTRLWTPWRIFSHVPVFQNIVPGRITMVTTLCLSTLFALTLSETKAFFEHLGIGSNRTGELEGPKHAPKSSRIRQRIVFGGLGSLVALGIAGVGIYPIATSLGSNVPLEVSQVEQPPYFANAKANHLSGQVILTFPVPVTGGLAMTWQALDAFSFNLATGAGPESIPTRAGNDKAGLTLLTNASSLFAKLGTPTKAHSLDLRHVLHSWGVSEVVIPTTKILVPTLNRNAGTAWALGALTLAIGRVPHYSDRAWHWTNIKTLSPIRRIAEGKFSACTTNALLLGKSRLRISRCIINASHRQMPPPPPKLKAKRTK